MSRTRTNAVPGEGPSAPTVLFIGEGPGFNEDQQGRPFVGRAGQLLEELLASVPMLRSDVFITNVVKCRPPDNREPAPEEVAACAPFLDAQIRLLNPRVIVTLGRHSLARFFPESRISSDHGRILKWRNRVVLPLYHPAAALRSTIIRAALEADFKRLPEAVIESIRGGAPAEPPSRLDPSGTEGRGQLPLF
ncbi:MAG: uracil-DNA glycosylase [Chloroflexi bacterium]|nr:uracil-DNA glycosylase [Chloroflexota bacterium]